MTCVHCGSVVEEHRYELQLRACPECGEALEGAPPVATAGVASPGISADTIPGVRPARPQYRRHALTFTGSAGEFFRIWIVNIFLTVITLGIYNAWAKVRTRQYFYANTQLAGHSFDYLANPLSILKGNLIIGAGVLAYYLTQQFAPMMAFVVIGLFYLVFPYLAYVSLKFKAHYSAYRNIRFRFHGTLGQSYVVYLLLGLLIPLTLGLIIPYLMFRQKRYFFDNFAFGTTRSSFAGAAGRFYTVYVAAFFMGLGAYAAFFIMMWGPMTSMAYSSSAAPGALGGADVIAVLVVAYLALIGSFTVIQQYVYSRITNYAWSHSTLGEVRFESTLSARKLVGIRLTNLLAMICSLGLLIPWAKVRYTRYLLDNLTVVTEGDLDSFTADYGAGSSALGEVATDFFDLDIGL